MGRGTAGGIPVYDNAAAAVSRRMVSIDSIPHAEAWGYVLSSLRERIAERPTPRTRPDNAPAAERRKHVAPGFSLGFV